jgi:hypothetical protein
MAKFSMSEADNYGSNGGGSFFTLKDDKDTARVRFLYNSIDDVEGYAVHEVEIGGKKRYVNCLRSYKDPLDACPFCAAQMRVVPKLFIKLFNEDAGECQIWERGKAYFQRLASLSSRYNPLVNEVVEIERSGKKGDMQTTYEFYPIENSEVNLDDYDCSEPLGTIILDKTAEEMYEFLDSGAFPASDSSDSNGGGSEGRRQDRSDDRPVGRRTPSNNNPGRRAF